MLPQLYRTLSPRKKQWFYVVKPHGNRGRYRFGPLERADWRAPLPQGEGWPTQVDVHRFACHEDMAGWLRGMKPADLPFSWFEAEGGYRFVVINHRTPGGDGNVYLYDYVPHPKLGLPARHDIRAPYAAPRAPEAAVAEPVAAAAPGLR